MTNSNSGIMKKVQGLLAKTVENGCTQQEAAAAAGLAQKLIDQHKLSMIDIEADEDTDEPIEEDTIKGFESQRSTRWKGWLADELARANDCKMYIDSAYNSKHKSVRTYKIIGRRSDIQIVNYMFAVISREIETMCKREKVRQGGQGKTWTNSFKVGAVQAVVAKLKEGKEEAKKEATTAAIVRVEHRMDAVDDWMENNGPKLSKAPKSKIGVDRDAWSSGYKAGKSISTNAGLSGKETKKLN